LGAAKLAGINDAKTKQTIIKSAASYLDKSGDVPLPHRTEADIEKAIRAEDRRLDQALEIGNHSLVGINSPILKPVQASTMAFLMLRGGWPPQRIAEQLQAFQVPYSQEGEDAPFFVVRKLLLNARESAKRRERLTPLKEVGAVVCAMNAVERGITKVHRKAIRDAVAKVFPPLRTRRPMRRPPKSQRESVIHGPNFLYGYENRYVKRHRHANRLERVG
jgi:hypothetical protein